jgi:hypothetical protein
MARREEGTSALDEAETLLREAVRLAPGDVVQASRLVWLLLDIAKGVPARAASVRGELRELLDGLLQGLAPQKKHDAFWLGLDWDRMFEDVQEAERELSVAYSTACELSDRN